MEALIAAAEGLVMHRASKREAGRMMRFLAKRLIPVRSNRHPTRKASAR